MSRYAFCHFMGKHDNLCFREGHTVLLEAARLTLERLQEPTAIQAFEAIGQGGMLPALYRELETALGQA